MSSPGRTLSEFDSKKLLRDYAVPTVEELLVEGPDAAVAAARELGLPVAVKLCAASIAHKTERDLVRLGLANDDAVRAASSELLAKRRPDESDAKLLVQRMARGRRELIVGMIRDRQFGPCVMLGLGGVLAEAVQSVVFRAAPLDELEALAMIDDLAAERFLGAFRGEPPVDRASLARVLTGVGRLAVEHEEILSIDVNPLIIVAGQVGEGRPVAVDALVELGGAA